MIGAALAALPQRLLAEVVGVVIEVALVAGFAYHYTHQHDEAVFARERAAAAEVAQAAAASAAAESARRVGAQQEIVHAAQEQAVRAAADAADARRAGDALRVQLDAVVRAHAALGGASAPPGGPPTGDAIGVLADVLGRADARAGELAAAADAAHAAGVACERAYESLR